MAELGFTVPMAISTLSYLQKKRYEFCDNCFLHCSKTLFSTYVWIPRCVLVVWGCSACDLWKHTAPLPITLYSICFFKKKINLFIYWLRWVFVAVRGLSLVVASRGYCSLRCTGFSLRWLLFVVEHGL